MWKNGHTTSHKGQNARTRKRHLGSSLKNCNQVTITIWMDRMGLYETSFLLLGILSNVGYEMLQKAGFQTGWSDHLTLHSYSALFVLLGCASLPGRFLLASLRAPRSHMIYFPWSHILTPHLSYSILCKLFLEYLSIIFI